MVVVFTSSSPWGYFARPEGFLWPHSVVVLHCRIAHDRYPLLPGLRQAWEGGERGREREWEIGGKEGGRKGGGREGGREEGERKGENLKWRESYIVFTQCVSCHVTIQTLPAPGVDTQVRHISSLAIKLYHSDLLTCMYIHCIKTVLNVIYDITHFAGCTVCHLPIQRKEGKNKCIEVAI